MFSSMGLGDDSKLVLAAIDKSLAIIEFDMTGKILTANANFCQALGYSASEIVGKHHSMFVEPDYARSSDYRQFWEKLGRGEFDAREYMRIGKGGKEIWIQASYNPVKGRSGKPYKVVKFATDITEAKMKSADDDGKITAISRAQAMIEFDLQGTILNANENFCMTLGYDLSEIKGKHHSMFVDPSYARSGDYKAFWDRLRSGEFVAEEFKRIGKGGKEVWIQASYNPILDQKGRVMKVVKFATDITGRVSAVHQIGAGLQHLAEGDLEQRITQPFIPSLDQLRLDFNNSIEKLQSAMQRVGENTSAIRSASDEIRTAADDLSRRTEQQAASVEETAAAVEEVTASVKESASRAEEAGALVSRTKASAEKSGAVVREAVSAMEAIEETSRKIGNIIGMIDEIAFQTNLLALNAGVEAARAGEAGKGFAVVAQEVRELAQRSANAAKEIKTLINTSSQQVKNGSELVGETGKALEVIVAEVQEVNANVMAIVDAVREQSTTLSEINQAVTEVDKGTQQNAAMVEESTAASHGLAQEAQSLAELLAQFKLGGTISQATSRPAPVAAGDARATQDKVAKAIKSFPTRGNAAVKADDWEEF
ncbi:MAG: chemotaxis protein [Ahrensia sp.]|nr:chemotaxis protein [Ahrensia sp.]|tara:strand:+ start:66907 stop:68697 length:1791 start_codon:yes stop_codon:yes gene_type:complete